MGPDQHCFWNVPPDTHGDPGWGCTRLYRDAELRLRGRAGAGGVGGVLSVEASFLLPRAPTLTRVCLSHRRSGPWGTSRATAPSAGTMCWTAASCRPSYSEPPHPPTTVLRSHPTHTCVTHIIRVNAPPGCFPNRIG